MRADKETFAECSICYETASVLQKTGEHSQAQREGAKRRRVQHIQAEAENRNAYIRRTFEPIFDHSRMVISGALSIVIDKPTKETTRLPALRRFPKYLHARMPCPMIGAIIHGFGPIALLVPPANTEGINTTIETAYLAIVEVQKKFKTPRKLHLQGDNHPDNKTPALFCFMAWLIAEDVIDEATLNFLLPGHGHMDLDRLFSVWMRNIKAARSKSVTRSRLMNAVKRTRSSTTAATTEVTMDGVRDWSGFFASAIADMDLHRYGMSAASNEGIYQFIFKKSADGTVELFYKHRALDSEVYPKSHQVGQNVVLDGKSCTIVDCKFNGITQLWDYVAESQDAIYLTFSKPPVGIPIFAGPSGKPEGMPVLSPSSYVIYTKKIL